MRNTFLIYTAFGPPAESLSLETAELPALEPGRIRVAMSLAPVNPSDLIPITGAYAHRIPLPSIAGYEGVGRVVGATGAHAGFLGKRVLPLRGPGTWQTHVDCDPALAIPVPDSIADPVAARAYINPLAAMTMLARWPVAGKRVLLSGAGSACAELLGQWALRQGAVAVQGIYRSASRVERLLTQGIEPVCMDDAHAVERAAARADIVFDSLGGAIGSAVLAAMAAGSDFVGYGLLSGQNVRSGPGVAAAYRRFHLRDTLAKMSADAWQQQFAGLWLMLMRLELPPVEMFPLADWRSALAHAGRPGADKALLRFG